MKAEPKARRPRRMARSPNPAIETSRSAGTTSLDNLAAGEDSSASKTPPTPLDTMSMIVATSQTKAAQIIVLMERPAGASLDELIAATGWLPHTTRAALTGLRKKGHMITGEKIDGVRRYRIIAKA